MGMDGFWGRGAGGQGPRPQGWGLQLRGFGGWGLGGWGIGLPRAGAASRLGSAGGAGSSAGSSGTGLRGWKRGRHLLRQRWLGRYRFRIHLRLGIRWFGSPSDWRRGLGKRRDWF